MSERPRSKAMGKSNSTTGPGWEFFALLAACLILLTPFIYRWRAQGVVAPAAPTVTQFAGTATCRECHPDAYQKWQGSDHDRAMAEASEKTGVWFPEG